MWAVVAGAVKGFGFTVEEILYEVSFANLILMGATLPSYDSGTRGNDEKAINADDPRNREAVRNFFENI